MKFASLAVAASLVASPAFASVVIDFENVTGLASVGGLYSNVGANFGLDALGVDSSLGIYTHAPSPAGTMTVVGPDSAMDYFAGFTDFSFWYSSSQVVAGGVQAWSGLGGTGTLLASFDLANNAQAGGCSDSSYCNFSAVGKVLSQTAHSLTFAHTFDPTNGGVALFDNIQIPEPNSALLAALALGGLFAVRRRRG